MRVMILGDSPLITTGFGSVNARAAKRLQSEGHEVASVAGLTKEAPKDDEGIRIYVPSNPTDVLGIADIDKAYDDFKPDVFYFTADPGSVTALAYGAPDAPAFIYTPIEGEPIVNQDWRRLLRVMPAATVSQYGADTVKRELGRTIPWYYHGVDHNIFQQTGIRDKMREQLKWQDKFVVVCVATNVRRKQITRLTEAFAILKHQYKQKDMVLYLHTVPFQNYWLEGWNLIEQVRALDIEQEVFFHPLLNKFGASVDVRTDNEKYPGLVEMMNAGDLMVLPSQVEGFGLPIAESMACGLPVAVTKYAAGWEVARPAGVGLSIKDWETHKSGTKYANVDVEAMAKTILRLKRDPKELERMRQRGLKRATDFTWDAFEDNLIPNLEKAIESHYDSHAEETEAKEQDSADGRSGIGTQEVSDKQGSESQDVQEDSVLSEG